MPILHVRRSRQCRPSALLLAWHLWGLRLAPFWCLGEPWGACGLPWVAFLWPLGLRAGPPDGSTRMGLSCASVGGAFEVSVWRFFHVLGSPGMPLGCLGWLLCGLRGCVLGLSICLKLSLCKVNFIDQVWSPAWGQNRSYHDRICALFCP